MFRFVILVAADHAPLQPPPKPPAPDLTCVLQRERVQVWATGARGGLQGHALADGYLLGMTAGESRTCGEVASSFGAYVMLQASDGRGEVKVLRDPSGRVPAYVMATSRHYVVASHVDDLLRLADAPHEIDLDYLGAVLTGNSQPTRRTGLAGVTELLPGEELVFGGPEVSSRLAWDPAEFYGRPFRAEAAARTAFRRASEDAVGAWAGRYESVTLDLSGGLDSSIVLGLLATSTSKPRLVCVNAMVQHEESDERVFARAAASLHGATLEECDLSDHVATYGAIPDDEPLQPRPTSRLLRIGLSEPGLAAAVRHGAQAYFTGRGGDHVFFDHVPSSAAGDYLTATWNLPGWLRRAYEAARLTGKPLVKILAEPFERTSGAERLQSRIRRDVTFLAKDTAELLDPAAFVHPWITAAIEKAPAAKLVQVGYLVELQRHHDRTGRATLLDEAHPFMSQPVFEAAMRTPSYMFAPGGTPRGLQRETFRDLLPPEIYARRTKGATTSHTVRTIKQNLTYVRHILLDGELVRRGLLDREALERRLTPAAMLDGRFISALMDVLAAQMWVDLVRARQRALSLDGALRRSAAS